MHANTTVIQTTTFPPLNTLREAPKRFLQSLAKKREERERVEFERKIVLARATESIMESLVTHALEYAALMDEYGSPDQKIEEFLFEMNIPRSMRQIVTQMAIARSRKSAEK